IHTELVPSLGPIEGIFNTASHHRVHHARNPRYLDRNYGAILIIWDRLFGSFATESRMEPPVYGVVEPLGTFDPLWAQVDYWRALWRKSKKHPGHRLRQFWGRPDWTPNGPKQPPAVSRSSYVKFDAPLAPRQRSLVFILIVLASTGTFLL